MKGLMCLSCLSDKQRISARTNLLSLFFLSLLLATASESQAQQTRHILVLNSYHKDFQWTDDQTSAVKEVLTEAIDDLEFYVEYMDTKRIYTPEYMGHLFHVLRLKYAGVKLDGIIATDDNALRFVMKYHEEVFGGAPVSFCGINDYQPSLLAGQDAFTGVIEVLDIKPTIDLAVKLHPSTQTVYVIVDNTPTGIGQRRAVEEVSQQYEDLKFEYLSAENYSHSELLEKLRTLPENSVVLLAVWLRDRTNAYIPVERGGPAISSASTVPVYGIVTMFLSQGIVGGKLLSSRAQGTTAAKLMLRILDGESPAQIPVIVKSVNPYMFDYRQLQRWHIDMTGLPEDSLVSNRPESFYYKYHKLIWSVTAIVIIQSALIIALFVTMALRKRAEKSLQESEKKFRNLTENAPIGIAVTTAEGAVLEANPAILAMFGYDSKEEFLSNPIITHYCDPTDRQRFTEESEKGAVRDFEVKLKRKDGTAFWGSLTSIKQVADDGTIQLLNTLQDTTERKQAEQAILATGQQLRSSNQQLLASEQQLRASNQALLQSELLFRDFFENAPIGFHIFDSDQIITDVNDSELEMIGYSRDEIVGKKIWTDLIVPAQKELFKKHWHEITTKGKAKNLEYKLVHKQGHHIDVILNASSRFDASGQLINTHGSIINVTERKKAEAEREQLLATLALQNEELESILYVTSHDLKSPIVNIHGFSGELAELCEELKKILQDSGLAQKYDALPKIMNEGIPETLRFITAGTLKMQRLLDGMLQVSRISRKEIDLETLDMNRVIQHIRQAMAFQINQKNVSFTAEELPPCRGDKTQIDQVFTNLIDNALKYLDPSRKGQIHVAGRVENGMSIYCVHDNGTGMAKGHQAKIFELFHRLNPQDGIEGEGLGLTIVKRIVQRHRGTIHIESTPTAGSKFYVSLPTA